MEVQLLNCLASDPRTPQLKYVMHHIGSIAALGLSAVILAWCTIACGGSPEPSAGAPPLGCVSVDDLAYVAKIETAIVNWQHTIDTIASLNEEFIADQSVVYDQSYQRDYVSALAILKADAKRLADIPAPHSAEAVAVHQKEMAAHLANFGFLQELWLLEQQAAPLEQALAELDTLYDSRAALLDAVANYCP